MANSLSSVARRICEGVGNPLNTIIGQNNGFYILILAIVVGIVFVGIFFVVIKQLMRLAEDDSFKPDETLGKTAEVYLTIPKNRTGNGKILISVKGSVRELEAMTDSPEPIPSHTTVKVVRIENKNVLIVEKI